MALRFTLCRHRESGLQTSLFKRVCALVLCIFLSMLPAGLIAQSDTTLSVMERLQRLEEFIRRDTNDPVFTGTRIRTATDLQGDNGFLTFSGYLDAYYALYSDDTGLAFEKFPTIAPRNNAFSLNLLQFTAQYQGNRARGIATLQAGDVVQSAWSSQFGMIQEANAGFRLAKRLWLDGGFFRTHIGVESVQPRENITSTVATTTYYEPYFLSGLKLTYSPSPRWNLQLNAFNGFNTFVETNRSKDIGISINFNPREELSFTFNSIAGNDSLESLPHSSFRIYNNLFATWKGKKVQVAAEANLGWQDNTVLQNGSMHAWMYSGLLSVRYRVTRWFAPYVRAEAFEDSDEILTGPVENQFHQLVGLNIWGITTGIEFRPNAISYFRLEARRLQTGVGEDIFLMNGSASRLRYEALANMGVWF